ncbi:hypothetical protein TYRP_016831 [Tyrophagus putrescentiae]|nr:hypothetical protein TYRP_016831 [Tyrophagus putrescentiae]
MAAAAAAAEAEAAAAAATWASAEKTELLMNCSLRSRSSCSTLGWVTRQPPPGLVSIFIIILSFLHFFLFLLFLLLRGGVHLRENFVNLLVGDHPSLHQLIAHPRLKSGVNGAEQRLEEVVEHVDRSRLVHRLPLHGNVLLEDDERGDDRAEAPRLGLLRFRTLRDGELRRPAEHLLVAGVVGGQAGHLANASVAVQHLAELVSRRADRLLNVVAADALQRVDRLDVVRHLEVLRLGVRRLKVKQLQVEAEVDDQQLVVLGDGLPEASLGAVDRFAGSQVDQLEGGQRGGGGGRRRLALVDQHGGLLVRGTASDGGQLSSEGLLDDAGRGPQTDGLLQGGHHLPLGMFALRRLIFGQRRETFNVAK